LGPENTTEKKTLRLLDVSVRKRDARYTVYAHTTKASMYTDYRDRCALSVVQRSAVSIIGNRECKRME
jgi:hypothetical protein